MAILETAATSVTGHSTSRSMPVHRGFAIDRHLCPQPLGLYRAPGDHSGKWLGARRAAPSPSVWVRWVWNVRTGPRGRSGQRVAGDRRAGRRPAGSTDRRSAHRAMRRWFGRRLGCPGRCGRQPGCAGRPGRWDRRSRRRSGRRRVRRAVVGTAMGGAGRRRTG